MLFFLYPGGPDNNHIRVCVCVELPIQTECRDEQPECRLVVDDPEGIARKRISAETVSICAVIIEEDGVRSSGTEK